MFLLHFTLLHFPFPIKLTSLNVYLTQYRSSTFFKLIFDQQDIYEVVKDHKYIFVGLLTDSSICFP